jgi:hypothetical protein
MQLTLSLGRKIGVLLLYGQKANLGGVPVVGHADSL